MKWIGQHIWDFISRFRSDVYLEDISNAGTDKDQFLVRDGNDGKIYYRTGDEVLSDIGASSESTDLEFNGSTANGILTYGGAAQIDVESTLTYDGTMLSKSITPTTTYIGTSIVETPTSDWASGSNLGISFLTKFDNNINVAGGESNSWYGVSVMVDDDAAHTGTIEYVGLQTNIDFLNTNGTQKIYGIQTIISDGATAGMYGLWQRIEDGGTDLYFQSSDVTTVDYFSIATKASGATDITTVDGGGTAADLNFSIDGWTKFTSLGFEIENASATGRSALVIDNDDADQTALDIDADNTTANIIDVSSSTLTSGSAIFIDVNDSNTTNVVKSLIHLDYDKSGVIAASQANLTVGLNIDLTDAATNDASGIVEFRGVDVELDAASNQGTVYQTGYRAVLTDGDVSTSIGYYSKVEDGGIDFKAVSSADSGDYFSISTTTNGATTLTTVDDNAEAADITIQADGDFKVIIADNDPGRDFEVHVDGANNEFLRILGENDNFSQLRMYEMGGASTDDYFEIQVAEHGETTITTKDNAAHAADLSLAIDGDILLDNDGFGLTKITSDGVEIENGSSSGAAALLIDNNDDDQVALHIDATNTTANVVDIDAANATTGDILNIRGDALTNGNPIHVVHNDGLTTDINRSENGLIKLDYNKSGNVASLNTVSQNGINLTMHDAATSNSGVMNMTGIALTVDSAGTNGTAVNRGIQMEVTDGDTNNGIELTCEDGAGWDIVMRSSTSVNDYCTIAVGAGGAATIATVDNGGTSADLTLDAQGEIVLDAHTGEDMFFKENGTERIRWHLDSTPTMDVTGNFDIDSSGNISLDATGDIALNATGNDITVDTDNFDIASASAGKPVVEIKTTNTTRTTSSELKFLKDADNVEGGEVLGKISFHGDNDAGTPEVISYAEIVARINDMTDGAEEGLLTLSVASHDGELQPGLSIVSGDAEDEVDVTIGNGATSLTTIAGDATITGDLTVSGGDIYGPTDSSLSLRADTDMFFAIDVDNDSTSSFHWFANGYHGSKQVMSLSDTGELEVGGYGATNAQITIYDVVNDANGPMLIFNKERTNVAGGDPGSIFDASNNDVIGSIQFKGYDDGTPSEQIYAGIQATIADAVSGQEAGKLSFYVTEYDGTSTTAGLVLNGDTNADGEIDVTIGAGTASTTTIAGDLALKGDNVTGESAITITPSGAFSVAGGSSEIDLTTSGTVDINAGTLDVDATNVSITGTSNEIVGKTNIPRRQFVTPSDGGADGDVVYIGNNTGGTATVAGKIYYYASTGLWVLTNSDDPSTATGLLAVALGTDPDADGMLLRGTVDLAGNIVGTEALGSILYLDKATAGDATTAAPTATGDIVRVIGYALTTGDTNKIWFNPDNTWVEHV